MTGGFYAGTKAALFDGQGGRDADVRFYTGYSFGETFTYDISFEVDSLHGGGSSDYYPEISGSVARDFGLLYFRSGVTWAFDGRLESSLTRNSVYGFNRCGNSSTEYASPDCADPSWV